MKNKKEKTRDFDVHRSLDLSFLDTEQESFHEPGQEKYERYEKYEKTFLQKSQQKSRQNKNNIFPNSLSPFAIILLVVLACYGIYLLSDYFDSSITGFAVFEQGQQDLSGFSFDFGVMKIPMLQK